LRAAPFDDTAATAAVVFAFVLFLVGGSFVVDEEDVGGATACCRPDFCTESVVEVGRAAAGAGGVAAPGAL